MEINIKRVHGGNNPVIECIDHKYDIYRVRTDYQPYYDEDSGEQSGYTFIEKEFPYKPSMKEVRDFIHGVINAQTDEKILSGFVWNGINIWLSEENQRNFSEAQRIAASMPEAILPVTFKLGEDENGEPVYHQFETAQELTGFYMSAVAYINRCLAEGWQMKDNFDFTPYEQILSPSKP